MNYRHALAVIALALGLGGCASYPSHTRSDLRYEDGSYYSPADAGYGDYYFAPERRYDYYDNYGYSWFYGSGSPFYSFGGYCSARYAYCPPFWSSRWYDPYWRHHHASPRRLDGRRPYRGRTPDLRRPAPPPSLQPGTAPADAGPLPRREFRRPRPRSEDFVVPPPTRARPQPSRRDLPAPEPRQRRSESSDSSDEDNGGNKRAYRRGDDRRPR